MSSNIEERIAKIEEKQKQLEAQKKQLIARQKEIERKERTKRLITIGAIANKIGIKTVDEAESLRLACEKNKELHIKILEAAGAAWRLEENIDEADYQRNKKHN